MKKFLIFFLLATFSFSSFSQSKSSSDVYVKSYTRSNGTVVKGYYRTAPNSTNRDNFSTRGNVNPYTGKKGYVKPDNKPYSSAVRSNNYSGSSTTSPSKKNLYNELYKSKLYTKSFEDFEKQFSDSTKQKKLYNYLNIDKLYTKSFLEFQNQFFSPSGKIAAASNSSVSGKNTFQDGTMYCNRCSGGGIVSNVPDEEFSIELKKLSKIEFNGSGEGIMSFYKRGDDMSGTAYVYNEDSKKKERYNKNSSEPFAGVLKMDVSNMVLEDDKHIFIDDGLANFTGHEIDIILERQIILTLSFRIYNLSKGEAYYIFSPSQFKVLSMFNMKEILFRVNRKHIDKKTGKLNEEGKVFNYISKINAENTKELFNN